jgi:tRNA threonylcarbamoyl adenosine modification protein YeaZ
VSGVLWIAIETSGDQASVAVGRPGELLAMETVQGARRHAAELIPALERALAKAGVRLAAIGGILVSEGPGSFTGLRIGATVGKGLATSLRLPLRTASALLVMARGGWRRQPGATRILAVSDALRGEVYAALYDMTEREIVTLHAPHVIHPEALARWEKADLEVRELAGAAMLLDLLGVPGATTEVAELDTWEPEYGRPAEAQARWEAAHGRRLPDSAGTAR